jgi:hypothetical protein
VDTYYVGDQEFSTFDKALLSLAGSEGTVECLHAGQRIPLLHVDAGGRFTPLQTIDRGDGELIN